MKCCHLNTAIKYGAVLRSTFVTTHQYVLFTLDTTLIESSSEGTSSHPLGWQRFTARYTQHIQIHSCIFTPLACFNLCIFASYTSKTTTINTS